MYANVLKRYVNGLTITNTDEFYHLAASLNVHDSD